MKLGSERIDLVAEQPWHAKLLFGICFLHAVISERKKFGFLGWNRTYEFNLDDIMISVKQFEVTFDTKLRHVRAPSPALLQLLQYTVADCFYGGKIQDRNDYLTLETIVADFFSEAYEKSSEAALYRFPEKGGYIPFMDTLSRYPLNDTTEIFGMNANAENIDLTLQAENLIQSLSVIHPSIPQHIRNHDGKHFFQTKTNISRIPSDFSIGKYPGNCFIIMEIAYKSSKC
jgi:dynein heavy chain